LASASITNLRNVDDATLRTQQERGEAVEEILGGSTVREALQRWRFPT